MEPPVVYDPGPEGPDTPRPGDDELDRARALFLAQRAGDASDRTEERLSACIMWLDAAQRQAFGAWRKEMAYEDY